MKRIVAMLLMGALLLTAAACTAQETATQNTQTVAAEPYEVVLKSGSSYTKADTIYDAAVTVNVSDEVNAEKTVSLRFKNCVFNAGLNISGATGLTVLFDNACSFGEGSVISVVSNNPSVSTASSSAEDQGVILKFLPDTAVVSTQGAAVTAVSKDTDIHINDRTFTAAQCISSPESTNTDPYADKLVKTTYFSVTCRFEGGSPVYTTKSWQQ